MIPDLLFDVSFCPNSLTLCNSHDVKHPCFNIVNYQACDQFQLPEPWNGDLINAPILVISSNPSISSDELFPDYSWPKSIIADFFMNRFKNRGPKLSWVYKHKILLKTGDRGKSVRYWSSIQKRVEEITGEINTPGIDFCITELVRCKSQKEIGVKKALPECTKLYLKRTIDLSGACIILAVGKYAREFFNGALSYDSKQIIYIPAPNSFGRKKVSDFYTNEEIQNYRDLLENCKQLKKATNFSNIHLPSEEELAEFITSRIGKIQNFNVG